MNIFTKYKKEIMFLATISFITLWVYKGLLNAYYQQDEWLSLGLMYAHGPAFILLNVHNAFQFLSGEGRVLTAAVTYFLMGKYPLTAVPISIFALIFHTLNSILVFFLAKYFLRNNLASALAALFFAINSVSQGSVTWAASMQSTLPSTTLILFSLLAFFKSLESSKKVWKYATFILLYISLFFKEIGIYLFVFLPVSAFLLKKISVKNFLKSYWLLFLAGITTIIFRVWEFRYNQPEGLFLTSKSDYYAESLIARFIFYPITSFVLMFIPAEPFLNFARYFTHVQYGFLDSDKFILIAQSVVMDLLAISLVLALTLLCVLLFKKSEKGEKRNIIFWTAFGLTSFLPYIIISKNYAYLESRYFYVGCIAGGILLGYLYNRISSLLARWKLRWLPLLIVAPFLLAHALVVKNDISEQVEMSKERKSFINQLLKLKPSLNNKKTIFYVTGNRDYLVPGNKTPFQSGVGYTLMVSYYPSGNVSRELLKDHALYALGGQGYFESEDIGFGYFQDMDQLTKQVSAEKLKEIDIVSLSYDTDSQKLTDISSKDN